MTKIIRRKPHTYQGYAKDFFRTLTSSQWLSGEYIDLFEKKFAQVINMPHAVCTSYGLHAMAIILEYFNFNEDTEVLVPGYTAEVVTMCLNELNIPYRCIDIDPARATISLEDLKKKISARTKGIIITHLAGNICGEDIFQFCRDNNLIVIEDCAHTVPSKRSGPIGTLGDAAFFSLGYVKLINTFTGGVLVSRNEDLIKFARKKVSLEKPLKRRQLIRKFLTGHIEILLSKTFFLTLVMPILKSPKITYWMRKKLRKWTRGKMTNFSKFTNTQAILGLKQLEIIDQTLLQRESAANFIINNTKLTFLKKNHNDVYYVLIAIVSNAKKYHDFLLERGIDSGHQKTVMDLIASDEDLPGSHYAYNHYLLLPNYPTLDELQLKKIVKVLNDAYDFIDGKVSKI